MTFPLIDWLIVCIYFLVVMFVGLYLVQKPRTAEGYFLANRRLKWPFNGASMLASNISAEHFVGLAGGGYVGGWEALRSRVPAEMLSVIKPPADPNVPWTGIVLTVFLAGSFYWSMDQVLVQRVFAAESINEGRKGALFAAFLKLLPPFILVLPGIIAKALFPKLASADEAYPALLKYLMPSGLLGLTVAGISAALMGHLSATYNSVATLFTRDFYARFRPSASQERQVLVGRLSVLAAAGLGILWAPIIGNFSSLWDYLQTISIYLIMPFVGVFYMGVFFSRITSAGVWASVLAGFVAGPAIMIDYLQAAKPEHRHFIPFLRHPLMASWLHGAFVELLICLAVLWAVSLLTPRPSPERIATTLLRRESFHEPAGGKPRNLAGDYRVWMVLVLGITAALYTIWR